MIRVFLKKGLLGDDVSHFDMAAVVTPRALRADFIRTMDFAMPIDVAVDGNLLGDDAPELDQVLRDGQQVIILPRTTADVIAFLAYAVVYALVAYGVNYLINVLWPASKPDGATQERGDDSSQTYAWDGIKTNYGPGLPIPWVYGRHAVGGQGIWTSVRFGGPGFQSLDRLFLVLSLCEGPTHRIGERSGSIDRMGRLQGELGPAPGTPDLPIGITINGNLLDHTAFLPGGQAWIRPGTQDQTPLPSPFVGISEAFSPLQELAEQNDAFTFTFNDTTEVSGFSLILVMPNGAYAQNAAGTFIGVATRVEIAWRLQGATSWVILAPSLEIASGQFPVQSYIAATTNPTGTQQAQFPAGTTGPIEVRVTRITPSAGSTGVAQLIWRDIVFYGPHTLRYPLESLLALHLEAGARFSGGLPQVTVPVEGALVRVWDAVNGWSPRCWNVPPAPHNFNTHPPGRNPAWCLLDFLLSRWGLGNYLTEANIDLPAFREWAAFCDSDPDPVVPWGEPSFCIDLVGDQPRPAWDWVLTFCNAGRASPTVRNGKISVVYHYRDAHGDAGITVPAKTPTQLLTSGNVEKPQVKWISQANRPTIYQFQFLDEEANWAQDVFPVEDDEGSLNDASALNQDKYKPEGVQAFGVTRTSQLFREGKWRHRITRLVRRELTFVTGPWALAAEVGDLIDFQSEMLRPFSTDVPVAMQVTAVADTTHVTIDHALMGSGLQFVGRDPDGKPAKSNISSYVNTGNTSALVLATAVTVNPGAACVVGKVAKLTETYQIVAISLQSDLKREVQAIQWTPEAYDPITLAAFEEGAGDDTVIDPPALSEAPPPILGVLVVTQPNGIYRLTWARPPGHGGVRARVYLRADADDAQWQLLGEIEGSEILTPRLIPGVHYIASICLANQRGDVVGPDAGNLHTFVAGPPEPVDPTVMLMQVAGSSEEAAAESVDLSTDVLPLAADAPGIPITGHMVATRIASSFKAVGPPAGPWTATLWRRPAGGYFTPVATAPVLTSP